MGEDAIIAEELTYRYGDLTAVDHISFRVAEGEILGFLGPNGAGKTTTVKMSTGQSRPKEGHPGGGGHRRATDEAARGIAGGARRRDSASGRECRSARHGGRDDGA
jgi:ABC-type multidrug transport system ATPase subunit